MYIQFGERAEKMGLNNMGNGCYIYSDKFGSVVYRELVSKGGVGFLDDIETRHLGVWTSPDLITDAADYMFVGVISDKYQFVGNESLVKKIHESIHESTGGVGNPIFMETPLFTPNITQMRNEIIIKKEDTFPQEGNIYPLIIVNNSYNGSKAVDISFGIFVEHRKDFIGKVKFGFQEKLSRMRQVHLLDSKTTLTSVIGDYINGFSVGISQLVDDNFREKISTSEMMRILGLVEKIGKRKKKDVEAYINRLQELDREEGQDDSLTTWKLFLAITKFSTMEKNLNTKALLENIAERVIIVPTAMVRTIRRLQETQ